MLVLVAFTRKPHLTVDLLVLEHVHDVVEQFPAVATNQDVWIAWRQKLFLFLLTPFNKFTVYAVSPPFSEFKS